MEQSRVTALLEGEMLRKVALAKLDTPRAGEHLEVAEALRLAAEIMAGERVACASATR